MLSWLRILAERGIQVAQLTGSDGRRVADQVAAAAGKPIDESRAEAIDRRAGVPYWRAIGLGWREHPATCMMQTVPCTDLAGAPDPELGAGRSPVRANLWRA